MSKIFFRFAAISIIVFLLVGGVLMWSFLPMSANQSSPKVFVVRKGESLSQISSRLKEEKLIRNNYLFLVGTKMWGLDDKIQAGSFKISPSQSAKDIALILTRGRMDKWLTIIEGARKEEIAERLNEEFGIEKREFLAASKNKEGYLFPDTYLIPLQALPADVVRIMEENFEKKTQGLWQQAEGIGLSEQEVVVLASLVEREAKTDRARKRVAGIMIKRLENDWPLQVDATVQYAKATLQQTDSWWPKVSGNDLKMDSPYNTYQVVGLPPTPICNPSLSSLTAVVKHEKTPYWFYITDPKGQMHYGIDMTEHQQNIDTYLK